jgi:hypothetical protein
VHGTQAFEQIQGVWIMEMAELIGLRKNRRWGSKTLWQNKKTSFRQHMEE